jgi:hypothetical protein
LIPQNHLGKIFKTTISFLITLGWDLRFDKTNKTKTFLESNINSQDLESEFLKVIVYQYLISLQFTDYLRKFMAGSAQRFGLSAHFYLRIAWVSISERYATALIGSLPAGK